MNNKLCELRVGTVFNKSRQSTNKLYICMLFMLDLYIQKQKDDAPEAYVRRLVSRLRNFVTQDSRT